MNSPSQEIITIVDRNNQVTGSVPRHVMRRDNLIHRASYILVFNPEQELFIQKRTMTKDVYPGFWDVAAGGVVLENESYLESAMRELNEELSITNVSLHYHFDYFFEASDTKVWGAIFTCCHPGPFKLQEEEIDEGYFIPTNEVTTMSQEQPFTPDGLLILNRLQTTPGIILC